LSLRIHSNWLAYDTPDPLMSERALRKSLIAWMKKSKVDGLEGEHDGPIRFNYKHPKWFSFKPLDGPPGQGRIEIATSRNRLMICYRIDYTLLLVYGAMGTGMMWAFFTMVGDDPCTIGLSIALIMVMTLCGAMRQLGVRAFRSYVDRLARQAIDEATSTSNQSAR